MTGKCGLQMEFLDNITLFEKDDLSQLFFCKDMFWSRSQEYCLIFVWSCADTVVGLDDSCGFLPTPGIL